jgi:hypothetical protein
LLKSVGEDKMRIKIEHFKWFDNKPLITEFEGTTEEFEMLLNKGYVIPKDAK